MRYTGINENRYAGDRLATALRAANDQRMKTTDALMSSQEGVPSKAPSTSFNEIGANQGEFGKAVKDPKSQLFFKDYSARLQAFGALSNPSQDPTA